MPDRYQQVCEALKILAGLGVEPGFAFKLIVGLPQDPERAYFIVLREVLHCADDAELVRRIDALLRLTSGLKDLTKNPYLAPLVSVEDLTLYRDMLQQVFRGAMDYVESHMPIFCYLLERHRNGPLQPLATVFMALTREHLRQHGHDMHAKDYQEIAKAVNVLYPGALHPENMTLDTVEVRISKFWTFIKAKQIHPSTILTAVDQFPV